MKISRVYISENPCENAVKHISNWYDLASVLGLKTHILSYALRERDKLQTRIKLGDRVVYKSGRALKVIQSRLTTLVEPLFDALPGNECALAYRQGLSATKVVSNVRHAKMLITFDIKKYYDNVTLKHIEECLKMCGFQTLGARLVGRYCVVKKGSRSTLQQGSPVSPAISNIVGHFYFDTPIRQWLGSEHPDIDTTYVRYCDNIALFIHGDVPEGFTDRFKSFVKETLREEGFRTHKWNCIADSNPMKNQKFLGIVLNAQARMELSIVDRLRAILFNWCLFGGEQTAERFMAEEGIQLREFSIEGMKVEKLRQVMRGHINYVKGVNEKHAMWLEKLLGAATIIDDSNVKASNIPNLLAHVKKYKDMAESYDEYISSVAAAI